MQYSFFAVPDDGTVIFNAAYYLAAASLPVLPECPVFPVLPVLQVLQAIVLRFCMCAQPGVCILTFFAGAFV